MASKYCIPSEAGTPAFMHLWINPKCVFCITRSEDPVCGCKSPFW